MRRLKTVIAAVTIAVLAPLPSLARQTVAEAASKNIEQTVIQWRQEAINGSGKAQYALAGATRKGKGISIDFSDALFWYAQAATKGYGQDFNNLVRDTVADTPFAAYVQGLRLFNEKKYEPALEQFRIVEKAKIPIGRIMQAQVWLAESNPEGDAAKSAKLLKPLVKSEPAAMLLMGLLYQEGFGVKQDKAKAIELVRQAADAGYAPALCDLGNRYFEGRGVEKSYGKAVELYAKALEQGKITAEAATHYAACQENGWGGLTPDKEKADAILKSNLYPNVGKLLRQL